MSIASLHKANVTFAIQQIPVTLTPINPTATFEYQASKMVIDSGYMVDENGREEMIDTEFHIVKTNYSVAPSKGHILSDGTTRYKVQSQSDDPTGQIRKIQCSSEFQR